MHFLTTSLSFLLQLQSESAAQRAETINNSGPMIDDSLSTDNNQQNNEKADTEEEEVIDTKSITTSVMSESTIGLIHSKKSLTALVSKVKERASNNSFMPTINEDEMEGGDVVKEKAVPTPVISTVTDDNGARMAEKRSINKLAFKNRNPAL